MRKTFWTLVLTIVFLLGMGIVLIASAGDKQGLVLYKDSLFFLKHQAQWLVIALMVMAFATWFDYHKFREYVWLTLLIYVFVLVLLCVVFVFPPIKGSFRWINLGPVRLQPSEFAKLAVVLSVSLWLDKIGWRVTEFMRGIVAPAAIAGVMIALLVGEPDYGSAAVVAVTTGVLMFIAGVKLFHLFMAGLVGAVLFAAVVGTNENRMARVRAWWQSDSVSSASSIVKAFDRSLKKDLPRLTVDKEFAPQVKKRLADFTAAVLAEDFVVDFDRELAHLDELREASAENDGAVVDDRPKKSLPKTEAVIQRIADLYKAEMRLDPESMPGITEAVFDKTVQNLAEKQKRSFKRSESAKYQLAQATLAIRRGGPNGVGYNKSMQKQNYLPEAHTDFIFAIGAEEFGLKFSLPVMFAFAVLFVCGVIVTLNAADRFGRLLAFGVTFLVVFQAFFNIGVVTGCLPTKGIALPMISYGGTNLAASLAAAGILMNVARHSGKKGLREITRVRAG